MQTTSLDDQLHEIETELARQDRFFETFKARLASLGDVQLQLPQAFFDQLEGLAQTHSITTHHSAVFGIRG